MRADISQVCHTTAARCSVHFFSMLSWWQSRDWDFSSSDRSCLHPCCFLPFSTSSLRPWQPARAGVLASCETEKAKISDSIWPVAAFWRNDKQPRLLAVAQLHKCVSSPPHTHTHTLKPWQRITPLPHFLPEESMLALLYFLKYKHCSHKTFLYTCFSYHVLMAVWTLVVMLDADQGIMSML